MGAAHSLPSGRNRGVNAGTPVSVGICGSYSENSEFDARKSFSPGHCLSTARIVRIDRHKNGWTGGARFGVVPECQSPPVKSIRHSCGPLAVSCWRPTKCEISDCRLRLTFCVPRPGALPNSGGFCQFAEGHVNNGSGVRDFPEPCRVLWPPLISSL